jgi:hypothetical protein
LNKFAVQKKKSLIKEKKEKEKVLKKEKGMKI